MNQFLSVELADRLCLVLLHSLWQSALLAIVAVAASRWLHRGRVEAAYRWHAAALLGCMIALPLTFAWLAPQTRVAGAPPNTLSATQTVPAAPQLSPPTPIVAPTTTPPPFSEKLGVGGSWTTSSSWRNFAPYIAALYLLGVAVMFARLLRGLIATERLRRSARPINNSSASQTLRELAHRFHLRTLPILAETSRTIVPTVVGFTKPMVLLPTSALTGLTPLELELILAHELAHLRRGDLWMQLLQRLAEAVLFFNPALWYLTRRVSTLREECCDDAACQRAACGLADEPTEHTRLTYATALVRVVELVKPNLAKQATAVSLAATGRGPSELRRRIARLVGEPVREPVRVSWGAIVLIAGALSLALIVPNWELRGEEPNLNANLATDANQNEELLEQRSDITLKPGESYRGRDLTGMVIEVGFKSSKNADFTKTVLANAKLQGDTAFQEAKFQRCDLRGAMLTSFGAGFQRATFDRADADRITIVAHGASFQGATFRDASLKGAGLTGASASFQTAVFDSADLRGAKIFSSATAFQGVSVSDTNLSMTDLSSMFADTLESWEFDRELPPRYSATTKFPKDFDPVKAGWLLVNLPTADEPAPEPNYVIAEHVILREGKEIVTWEQIREQLKTIKEQRPDVRPQFQFTHGAIDAKMFDPLQEHILVISRELKISGNSLGSMSPGDSWRFDQIRTAADLVPDESLAVTGTIVDREGKPVAGVAVILVSPVDESISYKARSIYVIEGRVRDELDYVMTHSSGKGEFTLYPPKDVKGYFVALHPTAGFGLTRIDNFNTSKKLNLHQWAGVNCQLDEGLEPRQDICLSTRIAASDDYPEINISQHWSDRSASRSSTYNYAQVPPIFETTIERNFPYPDGGGSTSLSEMSIGLLPGEVRELKLGPPTPKQMENLIEMRKMFGEMKSKAAERAPEQPR